METLTECALTLCSNTNFPVNCGADPYSFTFDPEFVVNEASNLLEPTSCRLERLPAFDPARPLCGGPG